MFVWFHNKCSSYKKYRVGNKLISPAWPARTEWSESSVFRSLLFLFVSNEVVDLPQLFYSFYNLYFYCISWSHPVYHGRKANTRYLKSATCLYLTAVYSLQYGIRCFYLHFYGFNFVIRVGSTQNTCVRVPHGL